MSQAKTDREIEELMKELFKKTRSHRSIEDMLVMNKLAQLWAKEYYEKGVSEEEEMERAYTNLSSVSPTTLEEEMKGSCGP